MAKRGLFLVVILAVSLVLLAFVFGLGRSRPMNTPTRDEIIPKGAVRMVPRKDSHPPALHSEG